MTKFIDKRRIGQGGFGEVWDCEREDDGVRFAKKKLMSTDSDCVARFQREVRILSSLDHPNVVKIVGKRLDGAPPFWYAMPLYAKSLRDELLSLSGSERRVQVIFTSVLDAIEYAHAEGVIHRDLKLENVLINSDADLAVSDFGLGRILDSQSTRQTVTGFGMGTFAYMAPEQFADAKRADERSDIYSLGRMLYELHTAETLTPAALDFDRLPVGIAVVVRRATQQRPEDRYQSVTEMKKAWANVIDTTHFEAESEELGLVRAELAAAGSVTREIVGRLVELLAKRLPDDDLLHETVMQVHPRALVLMYQQDPSFTRDLLDRFCIFTGNQGWGFTYTDQIGNVCKELHQVFTEPLIRAALVECVVKVGVDHNRYHVMDVMDSIIIATKPAEDMVVADRLERGLSDFQLRTAAERIDRGKLPPALRRLFEGAVAASR